jgi:hypothetical protein
MMHPSSLRANRTSKIPGLWTNYGYALCRCIKPFLPDAECALVTKDNRQDLVLDDGDHSLRSSYFAPHRETPACS